MSNVKEYVGCKSIEAVNHDGNGNNLYNMWLTDEEIVRCKDCKKFKTLDCATYRALIAEGRIDSKGMFNPDGFCSWGERDA